MKNTQGLRKWVLSVLLGLITLFSFGFAHADTVIYGQSDYLDTPPASTITTLGGSANYIWESLGTGLNGVVNGVGLWINATSTTYFSNGYIATSLVHCDNNATSPVSGCTNQTSVAASHITSPVNGFTEPTFSSSVLLDPSKYYYVLLTWFDGNSLQMYGSTDPNYYAAGTSCKGTSSCGSVGGGLQDIYFGLWGSGGNSAHSSTVMTSPVNGSTSAGTSVTTSFSYTDVAADAITNYQWIFTDLTQSSGSFTLTGTPTVGTHTVSQSTTLLSGHTYSMTATLCSSAVLTACYGGNSIIFSVVSSNFSISTVYGAPSGSSTPSMLGYLASSSFYSNVASTSLPGANCGSVSLNPLTDFGVGICNAFSFLFVPDQNLFNPIQNVIPMASVRQPFSWFIDVYNQLVNTTGGNDASSSPTVAIDFSAMTCSGPWQGTGSFTCDPAIKAWLPTSLVLFSTTTMANNISTTVVYYMRSAFQILIAFTFGLYAFYRVRDYWDSNSRAS